MTREELEQRRRRLDEELRSGIALLESAHRLQVRALEMVWMSTSEEDLALPGLPVREETAAPAPPPAPSPPPEPPAPARPVRRKPWQLFDDVEEALARVPEVFDRNELCRALGYEPDRGSLYRTLQELVRQETLAVHEPGSGKIPTTYRKIGAAASPPVS